MQNGRLCFAECLGREAPQDCVCLQLACLLLSDVGCPRGDLFDHGLQLLALVGGHLQVLDELLELSFVTGACVVVDHPL